MEYIWHYDSPLGSIRMASDGESLTGLWLEGQRYDGLTLEPEQQEAELEVFRQTKVWLDDYFAGREPKGMPPLAPKGTAFRQEVWEILRTIPYGETMSYGEVAAILAERRGIRRMSAQAVGGAVGHNPISILIPCHRVIGSDGSMVGYGGGIDTKVKLLALEQAGKNV